MLEGLNRAGKIGLAAIAALLIPSAAAGQPAPEATAAQTTDDGWNLDYRGRPEAPASTRIASVKVRYLVDKEGKASRCEVLASSETDKLDEKTCMIIERMHFEPKMKNGKPIEEWRTQTVRYEVEN